MLIYLKIWLSIWILILPPFVATCVSEFFSNKTVSMFTFYTIWLMTWGAIPLIWRYI